jgi:hypothetical protein
MTIRLLTSDYPAFPPGWRAAVMLDAKRRLTRIGCHQVGAIQRRGDRILITTIQCYHFEVAASDYVALVGSQPLVADLARFYAACWAPQTRMEL